MVTRGHPNLYPYFFNALGIPRGRKNRPADTVNICKLYCSSGLYFPVLLSEKAKKNQGERNNLFAECPMVKARMVFHTFL